MAVNIDIHHLIETLKVQEGFKPCAYQDSEGWWTIGYGTLIDQRQGGSITEIEAEYLLRNRVLRTVEHASTFEFWDSLNHVRQAVLANMVFNLGVQKFRKFVKLIAALQIHDYATAAEEMLDSKWAKQVGKRAVTLADSMRTGMFLT